MRQGNITWCELAPSPDGFGHVRFLAVAQIALQGVGSDEERERKFGQGREQRRVPQRRAFLSRRKIVTGRIVAGKAEAHADDGDEFFIVERLAIHAEPIAQAVAGWIVERQARFVHANTGRLRDDANLRRHAGPDDGARLVRQVWRTNAAGADVFQQRRERTRPASLYRMYFNVIGRLSFCHGRSAVKTGNLNAIANDKQKRSARDNPPDTIIR